MSLTLPIEDEANKLLDRRPLALLIGMVLDQQIPMEKAFTSPAVLRDRLGTELDATVIAGYDPLAFEELFRTPPALHRFPAAMAKRVQAMAQALGRTRDDYIAESYRALFLRHRDEQGLTGADMVFESTDGGV